MSEPEIYHVVGAPGVGKTTLLPELVKLSAGIVVMDQDELLENGALIGVPISDLDAAPIWPAYNRMWRRIIDMVRRAGHPVMLLSTPPSPNELIDPAEHWLLLDCPDELRLRRLRARGWSEEWIEDAMTDAEQSRTLIPDVLRTDVADPATVAGHIVDWARRAAHRDDDNEGRNR